jgi:hypothetical protein
MEFSNCNAIEPSLSAEESIIARVSCQGRIIVDYFDLLLYNLATYPYRTKKGAIEC